MADNLKKQPKKGILKNSSSFESAERQRELAKGAKFDEMNIIATLHPKDKDYGHMKIEEPKTPFSYEAHDSGDEIDGLDAELLAQKIELGGSNPPTAANDADELSEEDEVESSEEKAKRKMFEMKRKHHYNEFAAVKLARKLMEHDSEEELEKESDEDDRIAEEVESDREKDGLELCDKKEHTIPD